MKKYLPSEIETKWQMKWEKAKLYRAKDFDKNPKKYILIEFPYPSGERLHVGHGRSYCALDAYSRKLRMEGFNVLYPIGWDAFGLPAENYAIKTGINPNITTKKNIANAKKQVQSWGLSFDWEREVNTTDPNYYKWTQWIFVQLYKKGLAYKTATPVGWCPSCKIILANEEIVAGQCERCGHQAERKMQSQWILKITEYAQRLLDDLKEVNYLPKIRIQQENWIGRSEGTDICFEIPDPTDSNKSYSLWTFTTRPDTLYGVTAIVIAPEKVEEGGHRGLARTLAGLAGKKYFEKVEKYIQMSEKKSELERTELAKEKTGEFTGVYAINPINKVKVPVWVADYVLGWYGHGAVMFVPAHDQRDWDFAKKYKLPIKQVIKPIFEQNMRDKDHEELLLKLLDLSKKNKKRLIVGGGWAADIHVGFRVRNHEDLDLYVPYEDVGWWKKEVEKLGFVQKILDSKKDRRYYVEMSKEDKPPHYLWVDFVGVGADKNGRLFDMEEGKKDMWKFTEKEAVLKGEFKGRKLLYFAPEVKKWHSSIEMRDKDKIDLASTGMVAYEGEGKLVNSGEFTGQDSQKARENITKYLKRHQVGRFAVQYKLRDWIFSRQHYWGEPIPMIKCQKCGWVPVPEKDLPVELPYVEKYKPTDTGESPLAAVKDWVKTKCPKCGGAARRETDTMPNWAGSNWYYLRYIDPKNNRELADRKKLDYWMPVDLYNGGMEHTTLHLLYSRFIYKFLADIKVVPGKEPYARRHSHGVVLGPDSRKMSKSFGNVVNPDDIVREYGADTFRLYEMFMGPFEQMIPWSHEGVQGCYRFLKKIWQLYQDGGVGRETPQDLSVKLHQTIKKVTKDLNELKFNTVVAAMMEFSNAWVQKGRLSKKEAEVFLRLLAPFAPHIAEELWLEVLKNKFSIHQQPWPKFDPKLVKEEKVEIVIQVNGKLRDRMELERENLPAQAGAEKSKIEKLAQGSEKVQKYLKGKKIKKTIFVPGKLINFVV